MKIDDNDDRRRFMVAEFLAMVDNGASLQERVAGLAHVADVSKPYRDQHGSYHFFITLQRIEEDSLQVLKVEVENFLADRSDDDEPTPSDLEVEMWDWIAARAKDGPVTAAEVWEEIRRRAPNMARRPRLDLYRKFFPPGALSRQAAQDPPE